MCLWVCVCMCVGVCVCMCGYVCVCVCVCMSSNLSSSRHVDSQFYELSVRGKKIKDITTNDSTVSRIGCAVHFAMNQ